MMDRSSRWYLAQPATELIPMKNRTMYPAFSIFSVCVLCILIAFSTAGCFENDGPSSDYQEFLRVIIIADSNYSALVPAIAYPLTQTVVPMIANGLVECVVAGNPTLGLNDSTFGKCISINSTGYCELLFTTGEDYSEAAPPMYNTNTPDPTCWSWSDSRIRVSYRYEFNGGSDIYRFNATMFSGWNEIGMVVEKA